MLGQIYTNTKHNQLGFSGNDNQACKQQHHFLSIYTLILASFLEEILVVMRKFFGFAKNSL